MANKKRFLKIGCITGAVMLFVGYLAFSTFLFKPFEGAWGHDVAGLIPRRVDFFLAKAKLDADIEDFPTLKVAGVLEATPAWQTLEGSPEYLNWRRENDLDSLIATIRTEVDKVPFGIEAEDIFGGEDVALAGHFRPGGLQNAQWAVYGRVNTVGKAGESLLRYPGLLGLENQGISVSTEDQLHTISGGQLQQPIYVTRVLDVVVLGTSKELVAGARTLEAAGGEDSMFISAGYQDYIHREDRQRGDPEFELVLDVHAMLKSMGFNGPLPDTESQRFLPAFLGRLIQVPSWKTISGIVGFPGGLRVDLHGGFSSERITDFQKRLYREESFDHRELMTRAARLAPDDCVMFAYLHGPVGDIARQAFESVEPALRSNLDDALRSTGHYKGLNDVIERLGAALRNRTVIILREQDYGPVTANLDDGTEVEAQHDGSPVFAVTIVTWLGSSATPAETLNEIRDAIGLNAEKFGLQGYDPNKPGDKGYYVYDSDGFETREFWSPLVPGTGMIATLFTDEKEHFWLTNHESMFRHVRATFYQGGAGGYPRLSENSQFQALVDSSVPGANLLVWFNPRKAGPTLRKMARRVVEDNVLAGIDWSRLRREEQGKLLPGMFPGKGLSELNPAESEQLAAAVDNALDEWAQRYRAEQIPALMAASERSIEYMEAATAMLFMLDLNRASFTLSARILTPLGEAASGE
ncbi:MAG: hypothetical protein ACI8QC_000305 [Planctomycetota bacterium]|jgi:hypothetical protein